MLSQFRLAGAVPTGSAMWLPLSGIIVLIEGGRRGRLASNGLGKYVSPERQLSGRSRSKRF